MANYNSTHTGAEVDAAVTKANALPSATEINNKLAKALLTPSVTLQSNELVGVGTNGEQIRVQLGEGVTLEGTTSPYTLKATGGGGGGTQLYKHTMTKGSGRENQTLSYLSDNSTPTTRIVDINAFTGINTSFLFNIYPGDSIPNQLFAVLGLDSHIYVFKNDGTLEAVQMDITGYYDTVTPL